MLGNPEAKGQRRQVDQRACAQHPFGTIGIATGDVFFFFSSRRRHTRSLRDWSSDVCSSDLPGEDREADYGPMTMPGQFEVVEKHIADALARGGRPVVGGMASIRKPFIGPVVLADVPEESRAVTDETFGPTVTVTKVADLAEGVRLANGGRYGLGATVLSGNKKAAMAAARKLRRMMTAINAIVAYTGVPALPFGGSGDSGFGRIHGADGLREFSRPKAITRQRMKPMVNLTSFT